MELFSFDINYKKNCKNTIDCIKLFKSDQNVDITVELDSRRRYAAIYVQVSKGDIQTN